MPKFVIVATAVNKNGAWGIEHDMTYGDMHTVQFVHVGDKEMAEARANIFNRVRQHGKAALKMIGDQPTPNMFVKLA